MVVMQAEVADGSGAGRRGDLRLAVSIGRQRIVSCCIVSGGSAGGEELSAGGSSEGIKRSLAAKVIRVVRLRGDGAGREGVGCGRAGERPDGCVVGIALKGIDGENQLRLALLPRNQRKRRHH